MRNHTRRSLPFLVALALVCALAHCRRSSPRTSDAARAPSATARTITPGAWDALLESVPPGQAIPKDVALKAWAMTLGPMPGVTVTHDGSAPPCGFMPMVWTLGHWNSLTPEQQQAVHARVADGPVRAARRPFAEGLAASITGFGLDETTCNVPQSPPWTDAERATARAMVTSIMAEITRRTGQPFRDAIEYRFVDRRYVGGPRDGACGQTPAQTYINAGWTPIGRLIESFGRTSASGTCLVEFGKLVVEAPHVARSLVAHELFHCFQLDAFEGTVQDYTVMSNVDRGSHAYIVEGAAAWVGEELAGGTEFSVHWWGRYLRGVPVQRNPGELDLLHRSYDAIGFYAHLDALGAPVWQRVIDGVNQGPLEFYDSLLRAAPAGRAPLTTLASATVRRDWGDAWQSAGHALPSAENARRVGRPFGPVRPGGSVVLDAPPAVQAVAAITLDPSVRFVVARGRGHVRATFAGTGERSAEGDLSLAWCVHGSRCRCPSGDRATGAPPDATEVPGNELTVALAGGVEGPTELTVTAYDGCTPPDETPPPPPPPPPPPVGQDGCLLGAWRLDTRRSTVFDALNAAPNITWSGTLDLDVTPARMTARSAGFAAEVTSAGGGVALTANTRVTVTGETSSSWSAARGRAAFTGVNNGLTFVTETRIAGLAPMRLPITPDRLPRMLDSEVRYECVPGRRVTFFYRDGRRAVYCARH